MQFLGKPVPDEPFPNTNNAEGFQQRVANYYAAEQKNYRQNATVTLSLLVGTAGIALWKFAPEKTLGALNGLQSWLLGNIR